MAFWRRAAWSGLKRRRYHCRKVTPGRAWSRKRARHSDGARGWSGWFDSARKAYRDIPINQQVELISLIGDVGLVNGAPQIHAHGAVGLPDGEVRGGHLLQAIAWPTLEVFFTAHPTTLIKKHDEETDLFLFDLKT